jgi:hypothetical protein
MTLGNTTGERITTPNTRVVSKNIQFFLTSASSHAFFLPLADEEHPADEAHPADKEHPADKKHPADEKAQVTVARRKTGG